jgi:hypothetical protein
MVDWSSSQMGKTVEAVEVVEVVNSAHSSQAIRRSVKWSNSQKGNQVNC